MHQRALVSQEKCLDVSIRIRSSINTLGIVLSCQGKYEEAEVMYRRREI